MGYAIYLKDKEVNLRTVNRIALGRSTQKSFSVYEMGQMVDVFDGGRVATPDLSDIKRIMELNPGLACFIEQENTFTWMMAEIREKT